MKTKQHRSSHPQPGSAVALQHIQGTPETVEALGFGLFFGVYPDAGGSSFLLEE